jgi:hypothetical protein
MGQYYKPVNTESKEWVYSHDVKSRWKRDDGKVFMMGEGLKLMEHSWILNKLMRTIEGLLIPGGAWYKKPIVWAGDYADNEPESDTNLYGMCQDNKKILPKPLSVAQSKSYQYIVNHTKKEFVDKNKVPSKDGWTIHPLSLLTCDGNGRGGGDFHGTSRMKTVGRWCRDVISLEKTLPEGYKEIPFKLTE